MSLYFHGVGEDAFFNEGSGLQIDIFYLLKALKSGLLSYLVELYYYVSPDSLVLAQLLDGTLYLFVLGHFEESFLVEDDNGNDKALSGFPMDEYLG